MKKDENAGINNEIVKNYRLYEIVQRDQSKKIKQKKIILREALSNKKGKQGASEVDSSHVSDLYFEVYASKTATSYGLKLMSKTICKQPFFRFDSAGSSHRNKSQSGQRLRGSSITTPHFQYYDPDGLSKAYKTPELKDEKMKEVITLDINKGVELFCKESKTQACDDFEIIRELGVLFEQTEVDPLININFDEA